MTGIIIELGKGYRQIDPYLDDLIPQVLVEDTLTVDQAVNALIGEQAGRLRQELTRMYQSRDPTYVARSCIKGSKDEQGQFLGTLLPKNAPLLNLPREMKRQTEPPTVPVYLEMDTTIGSDQ
jgi:hypothetical protein